jgi:flagellar protein FliO/FliZ
VTPARILPRASRSARLALGSAAVVGLAVAAAPGELVPSPARVVGAAWAAGAAALAARRGFLRPAGRRRLAVVARMGLGREAGVALIELDGRPLLLGFGSSGVCVLRACVEEEGPPPAAAPEGHP